MSSPIEHTFPTPHPVDLVVRNTSGSVTVEATETDEAHVALTGSGAEEVEVELDGDRLRVIAPTRRGGFLTGGRDLDIRIVVPLDSRLAAKVGSATLVVAGRLRDTQVTSGSGDVRIAELDAAALVETGSGDIRIDAAHGPLNLRCGSGDARVDVLGRDDAPAELTASTGSGDVRLGRVVGTATVKTGSGSLLADTVTIGSVSLSTASGDLTVSAIRHGEVQYKGASGDVRVGIPAGTPVWTDITTVSGRLHSTLVSAGAPEGDAERVEIRARTVSGDVELTAL